MANKVFISFFAFTGIVLQSGILEGDLNLKIFRMFTNISNLICGIYFILAAVIIAADKGRDGGQSPFPLFKGICTMSITLTGIVASAVIASEFSIYTSSGIATVLLHIVTPVLIMSDWFLFDTKGRWHGNFPIIWLCAPCFYFAYIMISAQHMEKDASLRFPYPFLDYELLGIPLLLVVILIISFFYIVIGYLFFFIDRKMARLEAREHLKKETQPGLYSN